MASSFHMIDVGAKAATHRVAVAQGTLHVGAEAFALIKNRQLPKGDALVLAEIAGIQGAKRTSDMIPLCHPLPLDQVRITHRLDEAAHSVTVYCFVATHAKTGVEMEALSGVSAALLTIYDLTKMVEPALTITDTHLLVKTGGKQGVWICPQGVPEWIRQEIGLDAPPVMKGYRVAVMTVSDRAAAGVYEDKSGAVMQDEMRRADCLHATPETPVTLPVQNVTAAGETTTELKPGFAMQIMTGAPVPAAADGVIMIEESAPVRDAKGIVTSITIKHPPRERQNIRGKGEDFQQGAILVQAGTRLTPHHILSLASLGIAQIKTPAMPEIAILATGNELHEVGSGPTSEAGIYNSNSPYLLAICREAGLQAAYHGCIRDKAEDFVRAVEKIIATPARTPRIILSTGAVSKGDFDFIPDALKTLRAETIFHRVAIKPGRPILFATLPNGDYFFGLPGNPISGAVGFRFFVMPLLRALLGLAAEQPASVLLGCAHVSKPGLRHFSKAHLGIADGNARAVILSGQESFKIHPLLQANGWVVIEEEAEKMDSGHPVPFWPASPWGFA